MNGKVERPHQTITKLFNSDLRDSNHKADKCCFACESAVEVYNSLYHSATQEQPTYLWYKVRPSIHDFRVWGCEVWCKNHKAKASHDRVIKGYFMGYTSTRVIIRWWNPSSNKTLTATSVKFNETNFNDADDKPNPVCLMQQKKNIIVEDLPDEFIDVCDHPVLDSKPSEHMVNLPPIQFPVGIHLQYFEYNNLSFITRIDRDSMIWSQIPGNLRSNIWILAINEEEPISISAVISTLMLIRQTESNTSCKLTISKRKVTSKTSYESIRSMFHQIRFKTNTITTQESDIHDVIIPVSSRVLQTTEKPKAPDHVGQLLNSKLRTEWLDSIFDNYEKMITTGTWDRPILRTSVPENKLILRPRLVFKTKTTDHKDMYDLYCCFTQHESVWFGLH